MITISVILVLFNCVFDQSIDKSLMTNASLSVCQSNSHKLHAIKKKSNSLDEISTT